MRARQVEGQQGLMIIELVVGLVISGFIIVALMRFMTTGFSTARNVSLQTQAVETVRLQLKRMVLALRQSKPSDTGSYAINEASAQKLVFYTDVNGDNVTERIRYQLVGTNLERGIILPTGNPLQYVLANETTTIISRAIQNGVDPVFTYYPAEYPTNPAPLPSPVDLSEVTYVEVSLRVDADANNNPPPIDFRTQVHIRNLKTNL